jgi:hypothetical protein
MTGLDLSAQDSLVHAEDRESITLYARLIRDGDPMNLRKRSNTPTAVTATIIHGKWG